MAERIRTRFLVVGSGVAGLHTAWRASADGDVLLLTKRSLFDSATAYAQGGIAAALGAGDSPDAAPPGHARRRRRALRRRGGAGARRGRAGARARAADAPARTSTSTPSGELQARHARPRTRGTASCTRTATRPGAEVARTLIERVRREPSASTVLETRARARPDRRSDGDRASACARASRASRSRSSPTPPCSRPAAAARSTATRPTRIVATGDGFAIAHRAGVTLADMEFVQFHPTALDTPENPLALISEAVRGEGAILLNARGERFMPKRHRLAELAPRDVVAREIFREQQRRPRLPRRAEARASGFAKRFPGIFALCKARGIDPRRISSR